MNTRHFASVSILSAALALSGCGKKDETSNNPSTPTPSPVPAAAATPAPNQDAGAATFAPIVNSGTVNFNSVDNLIQQGQYEQAVVSVITAQRSGQASLEDSLKIQRKMQDLQAEVVRKAAAGDQKAIEAMKLLRGTAPSGRGR